ncbi:MAG TPA: ATP-binding protein [Candidatus Cloacimonadota bacterium]|nr:ATP-binding protein [Candidatus Cloacimonadota bacterium]
MYIDHRYEVLESLGSGTWAKVFKVKDIRSGHFYTLKLFQYLSSEDLYARFSAEEMHHITRIEHPNLSHVVDFGHVGDHIYFISDWFDGTPLTAFRFSKGKIDLLYDLVAQCAYALHALHTQNILHKDLKPENIIYRQTGKALEVKLIDYGFAVHEQTRDNQLVSGTLPYVAPEVYLGQRTGPESDFYAMGVILYRLCTGTFPFNLDQISALMSGSQQYFIPIFPSELNKDIPLALEKLILRLLERNPDHRFSDAIELIVYLNRVSGRSYPFSLEWSLVNTLRFNSYIVRERYSHQLLDYLPAVRAGNGKIVSLIGGDGLGKDSILSLFRYHLLGGECWLFDYSCTRTDHEAFFALIKEYLRSLPEDEQQKFPSLSRISDKFKAYLNGPEQAAKSYSQGQEELRQDFSAARDLLMELSTRKPIIFIIRDFQYVHRHTVDFINYLSPQLVRHRVLVVLSCNEFNKVRQIENTVLNHIPMLDMDEARDYMARLLSTPVPEDLVRAVYHRSAGNPHFIREILVDLTLRKEIGHPKEERDNKIENGESSDKTRVNQPGTLSVPTGRSYHFPASLAGYQLPSRVLHSIYSRMSHITELNYARLQKLAIARVPLSRELIIYILKLSDQELYSLINEATYNEILVKHGKLYYYTFPEARQRFFDENSRRAHGLVSRRVLKYYASRSIEDTETCLGLIENAILAGDALSARRYYLRLYHLQNDDFEQEEAYEAIINVLKIDIGRFEGLVHTGKANGEADCSVVSEVSVPPADIIRDLREFHEKTEATGFFRRAGFIVDNASAIPETSEKYLVLGTLKMLAEELVEARALFQAALDLSMTGRQRVLSYLYLSRVASRVDHNLAKSYLDQIDPADLNLELKIIYTDRLAVYYAAKKEPGMAIRTMESFLESLPPDHDTRAMINLAALHNDLGVFYSDMKNITEAEEHLNIALNIWKRHNIKRYLGLIYNNLADLCLKQGLTVKAQELSELGYSYSAELNLTMGQALALLNQGEAFIKMGEFGTAEQKLSESLHLVQSIGSTQYLVSIQRNLALAKSKIKGFGYFYRFISDIEPQLMQGQIIEVNPLVKTYFYYLHETANLKKLRRLIRKNVQINYKHIHEEEFYHNILSLIALSGGDYALALSELRQAMHFAGEINNNYAIAVFNVLQVRCLYGLNDLAKARELAETALITIRANSYRYWEINLQILGLKLDLMNPETPLRGILRKADRVLASCREFQYYQLEVEAWQVKLQIISELGIESKAASEFEQYRRLLDLITADIDPEDRENYLHINHYDQKNLKKFAALPLASRRKDLRYRWNDLLYNIANVNSIDRVKFLIEKGLDQVICPARFKLMVFSDKISNFYCFHCFNCGRDTMVPPELGPLIEKAFGQDSIVSCEYKGQNTQIIPLVSGSKRIGYLLMSDDGELEFTRNELTLLKNIKQHLTALIVRVNDYSQITHRVSKMNELMAISNELMGIVEINDLQREIVSTAIDFTNATRGFLIKRDPEGNNVYQVQMDNRKQILATVTGLSKTALSLCQNSLKAVSTYNAQEDNSFKNSISVQDYAIHTIFCCPLLVNSQPVAFLYLDNLGESGREMYLNEDIISLFQAQAGIALKNAAQYEAVVRKSHELNEFEALKDEFMAIVTHELNTPLTALQGYVSRLKRKLYSDEDERQELVSKLETSVRKLIISTGDISTMNYYNLARQLAKAPFEIGEILELVHQEVDILSRKRKMFIKMEIEKDLPPLRANWEAVHRMVHNVVLNAIRFTNDFGNVVIGARRSVFPSEKINNRESLVIFVQDNGIGIPAFQLKNIFRKFYELNEIYAHKSGTVEYRSSGLGLGLATAKRIAELHGGEITIKSKEREGTTVFMILPFKDIGSRGGPA